MFFIQKQKTGDAAGRYSPLGALYNMRPPNGASVAQQRSHHQTDVDDDNDDDKQQQPTVVGGVKVATSPTGSGSGSGSGGNGSQQVVKEQSPSDASSTSKLMWTPDRLISSMPPGTLSSSLIYYFISRIRIRAKEL